MAAVYVPGLSDSSWTEVVRSLENVVSCGASEKVGPKHEGAV